jgi:probable HAF family extracellular repeat protein
MKGKESTMKEQLCKWLNSGRLLLAGMLVGLNPQLTQAVTRMVTTLSDNGAGSLRDTITVAGPGDTISFAVSGSINLASGELVIGKSLSIVGPGANLLTVSGNGTNRIFHVTNCPVLIANLRIADGHAAGGGGGIAMEGGCLTVSNCAITGCYAQGNGVGSQGGGAISAVNSASLTVIGSTLSGNSTAFYGGGVFLFNNSTASMFNSTVSGNRTLDGSNGDAWGGGIFSANGGSADITSSTIANNSSVDAGGGIYHSFNGTVRLANTIVAGNTAPSGPDCQGPFVSSGYNLISIAFGSTGWGGAQGDQFNLDALLAPLADNGGPTFTHALLAGSPALDTGNSFGLTTDQRGLPRPYDSPGIANAPGGDGNDIGAFEAQAPTVLQYTVADLGTLGGDGANGYPGSEAFAINNSGQIVGWSYTLNDANYAAVIWTNATSAPLALATFNGEPGEADGINDLGQIVGPTFPVGTSNVNGALWPDFTRAPRKLDGVGGAQAYAGWINRMGQAVGDAYDGGLGGAYHAVFWPSTSSAPVLLAPLSGFNLSDAYVINNAGEIVGDSTHTPDPNTGFHATYWASSSSAAVDLGTLGYLGTQALAINDPGQIVGHGFSATEYQAVFWPNSTSAGITLATPGSAQSEAYGINANGQIVGWAGNNFDTSRAVIWPNSSSAPIDLNTLIPPNSGWVLEWADAINDSGEIVGVGSINGHERAFALLPTAWALRITSITKSGNDLQLSFTAQAGHTYNVLGITDLATGAWSTVRSGIAGTGGTVLVTLANAINQPRQFFRIQQAQ